MITKYDLMLIKFNRDGTSWSILQRYKHYSASRMFLREKPQSVRFMIIVTDARNESTCEIIKVTRDVTETTPLSCLARAPLELVPRPGWTKHLASKPIKPPVLPTPQRQKKPLTVEVVDAEKTKSLKWQMLETTRSLKRPMLKTIRSLETTRFLNNVSKADVEQVTEAPPQQQPQQSTDGQAVDEPGERPNEPGPAAGPSDGAETVQQSSVEPDVDVSGDASPSASGPPPSGLDEGPLNVSRRVAAKAAPYEGSIARAVRLELGRVRYEKEARRKYLRARAQSRH